MKFSIVIETKNRYQQKLITKSLYIYLLNEKLRNDSQYKASTHHK